ncbi:MAG: AAA family ATPase [Planctomycetota bacterium]
MLVSFSVSNYRSFGVEETLNMVASNKLTEHPGHLVPIPDTGKSVIRTSLIYGANAAGKSNLVKAMLAAQRTIIHGAAYYRAADAFRFNDSLSQAPSGFEFRFLIRGRVFVYGFDIAAETGVHAEWLTTVKGNDEIVIFERSADGSAVVGKELRSEFPHDPRIVETLQAVTALSLRAEQLLLNRILELRPKEQGETLYGVIQWLTEDLVIARPGHQTHNILSRLNDDTNLRNFVAGFLRNVGTGVSDLELEEFAGDPEEWKFLRAVTKSDSRLRSLDGIEIDGTLIRTDPQDPTRVISRRLYARHAWKEGSSALPFSEESDGTQQLLHFIPFLLAPSDRPKTVVIDELDRSLHPLICWEFIRFFSESCPGVPRQLIVTTHEAHLLNQELLRRDEYWFVEKDADQQSRLTTLSDFKVRNDLKVEKGYLQGRFGAIPIIGSMAALEQLLQCGVPEAANATQE